MRTEQSIPTPSAEVKRSVEIGGVYDARINFVAYYGLLCTVNEERGIAHISQVSWNYVPDIRAEYRRGDTIRVQVIDRNERGLVLSIKVLMPDPWVGIEERFHVGQVVMGTVSVHKGGWYFVDLAHGVLASFATDAGTFLPGSAIEGSIAVLDMSRRRIKLENMQTLKAHQSPPAQVEGGYDFWAEDPSPQLLRGNTQSLHQIAETHGYGFHDVRRAAEDMGYLHQPGRGRSQGKSHNPDICLTAFEVNLLIDHLKAVGVKKTHRKHKKV